MATSPARARRRDNAEQGRVHAFAAREYLGALERAGRRRQAMIEAGTLPPDGKLPTLSVAIGVAELDALLDELGRRRRLLNGRHAPVLVPLVDELRQLREHARLQGAGEAELAKGATDGAR